MYFLKVSSPECGGHVFIELIENKASGETTFADSHWTDDYDFNLI